LLPMLMLLLAIPSDLASYFFGLARCRFIAFAAALALAEVPYALGAVYLGASFLERRTLPILLLGVAGVLLSVWAVYRLHRFDPLGPPASRTAAPGGQPGPPDRAPPDPEASSPAAFWRT
jgi:hypothetical protein